MKVIVGKTYIDKIGNIGIVSQFKDFYGEVVPGRFKINHIDNINFTEKGTVGCTSYHLNQNGTLENAAKNCPLDLQRRFILKDLIKLKFNRLVFRIAKKLSPNLVKSPFLV